MLNISDDILKPNVEDNPSVYKGFQKLDANRRNFAFSFLKMYRLVLIYFIFNYLLNLNFIDTYSNFINSGFNFLLAVLIDKFVSLLNKNTYRPHFLNETEMNLADVVDKISGPKKQYDIHSDEDFLKRQNFEYENRQVLFVLLTVFLVIFILLVVQNNLQLDLVIFDRNLVFSSFLITSGYFISMFILEQIGYRNG